MWTTAWGLAAVQKERAKTFKAKSSPGVIISIDGESYLSKIVSCIVPPGGSASISLEVPGIPPENLRPRWNATAGVLKMKSHGLVVEWTAPKAYGVHPMDVDIFDVPSQKILTRVRVMGIVMIPFEWTSKARREPYLKLFKKRLRAGLNIQELLPGFISVTRYNTDMFISPHFRLGQFTCKEDKKFPKLIALNYKLVNKLEILLSRLNKGRIRCRQLAVLSGYRSPGYNHTIGNVRFSRHQFGEAADVFVDENHDGRMDDLNHDGKINIQDAKVLLKFVDVLDNGGIHPGGAAAYSATKLHGPFVHIDVRGYKARW